MCSFSLGLLEAALSSWMGQRRSRVFVVGVKVEAGATCFIISKEKRLDGRLISVVVPPQCSGNLVPHRTSDPARSCVRAHA